MADTDSTKRLEALSTLFDAVLEKKVNKSTVEANKAYIAAARAEDVAFLIDAAIDRGIPFEQLKPAVSKLFNLLYEPLQSRRYKVEEGEYFLESLLLENAAAAGLLSETKSAVATVNAAADPTGAGLEGIRRFLERLEALEIHYRKLENILFPGFEARHSEYRCIRLMWSIHDDVRRSLRRLHELCAGPTPLVSELNGEIGKLYFNIHAVLFREESILFPLMSRLFSKTALNDMFLESLAFGFCLLSPAEEERLRSRAEKWRSSEHARSSAAGPIAAGNSPPDSVIRFNAGALAHETLDALFRTLPVDMTLVDPDDRVAWFSQGDHRIFPRSPSIIGRDVRNCHPKESVERVVAILEAFKSGTRDHEAFWIQLKDRFIHIEYFALRDPKGRYLGALEASQDLTEKRELRGEKRLVDLG